MENACSPHHAQPLIEYIFCSYRASHKKSTSALKQVAGVLE